MHLTSICLVTQRATDEPSPYPIPPGKWIWRLETTLHREITQEDINSIVPIGQLLYRVLRLARDETDPPDPRTLLRSAELTTTADIARLLLLPDRTHNQVGQMLGLTSRTIRHSRCSVEQWFNVRLLYLHVHAHHTAWWVPTQFARRVWTDLETIVALSTGL